jgi:K+-sensing histidine kinase KdpD
VGTGLGLAIVRELVTAMGGQVSVAATAEGGTRFVVTLQPATADAGSGRPGVGQGHHAPEEPGPYYS